MPPILSSHPIISATLTFQQKLAALTATRLAAGKTSLEDEGDESRKRKTDGVDFIKAASGPAVDAQRQGFPISVVDGVAIIRLIGPMDRYGDYYYGASTAEVTVAVKSAMNDESILQTVFIVNSPGGSVDGLAELGDAVKAHAAVKPIYAQVEGGAYSAGYYAIAHATAIYAHRMDEVGSIGTILGTYDYSEYFKTLGIEAVVIATGEFKGAGFPGSVITDAQREEWKRGVLTYYADFKKQIQVGRELTAKAVSDVADGRYWNASDAINLGLVDKIQTLDQTVQIALAKVAGKRNAAAARASIDKTIGALTRSSEARRLIDRALGQV